MNSNLMIRSPTLHTVINAVRKLYPPALANQVWDNTGLLLEAPPRTDRTPPPKSKILLTIDLTRTVAEEAISTRSSIIISYHPIIFRPLKALTLANPQQATLLRLAQEGISVYSPHTAVDARTGGLGDWLADGISRGREKSRRVIEAVCDGGPGHENAGMGRVVTLKEPETLSQLIEDVKAFLGLKHVIVCRAQRHASPTLKCVRTIGICAGSGASLVKDLDVDLIFTGELSHHDALAAVERGVSAITCFHTNTERGYLAAVMKSELEKGLAEEVAQEVGDGGGSKEFEVVVSAADCDPFGVA